MQRELVGAKGLVNPSGQAGGSDVPVAAACADWPQPCPPGPDGEKGGWQLHRLGRFDLLAAGLLAAASVAARWPLIQRGHTLVHSDEAVLGIMAQDIAAGRRLPIYFYGQRYMGALEAYVVAAVGFAVADPVVALRLGPALFFAALVAVQFLMLGRWFGRWAGLAGAVTLVAGSPMFAQWSISARGAYIEVLLWGTLLWWACGEWFLRTGAPGSRRHLAIVGLLIGSGFWLNPSIVAFALPVAAAWLLDGPVTVLRRRAGWVRAFALLDRWLGRWLLSLPALALLLLLTANCLCTAQVVGGRVRRTVLLGLVPPWVGLALFGAACLAGGIWLGRHGGFVRRQIDRAGPLVWGLLIGYLPAFAYVAERLLRGKPLEGCLPLAIRPLWSVDQTLSYLWHGLPVLFGADPAAFIALACTGRHYELFELPAALASCLPFAHAVALAMLAAVVAVVVFERRAELAAMLRLQPVRLSPAGLLLLALLVFFGLYLVSACAFDFTSIRYLVPVWAIVPAVVASALAGSSGRVSASSSPVASSTTPIVGAGPSWSARLRWPLVVILWCCWSTGQWGLASRIGSAHPLEPVARRLRQFDDRYLEAETLDAHLLSFFTGQSPPVAEYQPFWSRLGHYRKRVLGPISYIVDVDRTDWQHRWEQAGWPGPAPPEATRLLLPALQRLPPEQVLSRRPLAGTFQLWTVAGPVGGQRGGRGR